MRRALRDPSDLARARAAEAHAFRVDTRDAWIVAEDSWRAAGDDFRGDVIRRLRTPRHRGRRPIIENWMIDGVAEGYWLDAWASGMERAGLGRDLPRSITLTSADLPPRTVSRAATLFGAALELANGVRLEALFLRALDADQTDVRPGELGYYLVMQALGHGISWTDDHACFDVLLPRTEAWADPARRGPGGTRRWTFGSWVSVEHPRPLC